jgi:hypothetical protein
MVWLSESATVLGVPLQNSIRRQSSELQLKVLLLFCANHQARSSNDQSLPTVLSTIPQIKDSTSARDRVSPEAVGNTKSHLI